VQVFEREYQTHEKVDYYLAQIAQCAAQSDKPLKDFLIKFETKETAVKLPKNIFCTILKAAFGIKEKDKGNG
jgi:hypothetical protein